MSPARGIGRGAPTGSDLLVSLTIEQDPDDVLVARLVVDEPDGLLVELELTGDELALLLAGETVAVPGRVSGVEPPPEAEPPEAEPPPVDEPAVAAEEAAEEEAEPG